MEVTALDLSLRCLVAGLVLYQVGGGVLQTIRTHPVQSGVLLTIAVICALVMWGAAVRRGPEGRRRNDLSERIISVHEAGHALMYACAGRNPSLRVIMADRRNPQGTCGLVSSDSYDMLLSHDEIRWHMFTFLAGHGAEHLIFGQTSSLSHGDMTQYDHLIPDYFSTLNDPTMRGFVFAAIAPNDNPRLIAEVREAQSRALRTFLLTNRDLLLELAQRLERERKLNADDLYPLLSRVQITPDLPVLPGAVGQMGDGEYVPA